MAVHFSSGVIDLLYQSFSEKENTVCFSLKWPVCCPGILEPEKSPTAASVVVLFSNGSDLWPGSKAMT